MTDVARVSRGRAIAIAICAAVIGVLSYVLGVGSTTGQQAEASVLDAATFTMDPPPATMPRVVRSMTAWTRSSGTSGRMTSINS